MLRLWLVSSVLLTANAASLDRKFRPFDGKIIGGTDADIKDFPYQLSLEHYNRHTCGAVLIAENIAITAAHCTDKKLPILFSIRAGTSTVEKGGYTVQIKKVIQHPQFFFPDYDLSILILKENLPVGSPECDVIRLPEAGGPPPAGTKVNVTGWGAIRPGGGAYHTLQQVEVEVYGMQKCRGIYEENVSDRLFCAGVPEGGKDSCQGDSGGPLVGSGTLYGTVSGGFDCGRPNYPSLYASIPEMREWIRENTGI